MGDKPTGDEALRAYENLRETLAILAGKLSHLSFEYQHNKMAILATQASSEIYQAVSCIRRSCLKKNENIACIEDFVEHVREMELTLWNIGLIALFCSALYEEIIGNGHEELASHIKGAQKHLRRLRAVAEKV